MHRKPLACLLAVGCALARPALAQVTDPADDPLRGPPVSDHTKRTLVRFNMSGQFEPIEGRPEAAAALLLDLDEQTAQRVKRVIDARDMAVATLLVDQIDLVAEISDEIRAGDNEAARARMIVLWERFEPDHPRRPLLKPLKRVLGPEQFAEVVRLTDEYWETWIDQRVGAMDDREGGRRAERREQTEERLAFELFQGEVRTGYEATLRRYRDALEAMYQAVGPTEEQRAEMRRVVIDHIRATKLKATPEERRAATRKIYDLLDEDRRGKLFDYLLKQVIPDNQ